MQTIEEKAREIYLLYKEKDRVLSEGVLIGFMKGVEFAQQWISVDEELPQVGGEYLVKRNGVLEIEKWTLNKKNVGFWWDYLGITHWRPINIE